MKTIALTTSLQKRRLFLSPKREHCHRCSSRLRECATCEGKGRKHDKTCPTCMGSGLVCPNHGGKWE